MSYETAVVADQTVAAGLDAAVGCARTEWWDQMSGSATVAGLRNSTRIKHSATVIESAPIRLAIAQHEKDVLVPLLARCAPFVGRERELGVLLARLDDARGGAGGVALVAGEPSSGKTRLLAGFATRARRLGWIALSGRAYETAGMPPYLPFSEALRTYAHGRSAAELRTMLEAGAAVQRESPDTPPAGAETAPNPARGPGASGGAETGSSATWSMRRAGMQETQAHRYITRADAHARVHGTGWAGRLNKRLGVVITNAVGTMYCAYAFAALALVSLPAALRSGDPVVVVSWISQTFLQLVLLSIIIVGQQVISEASDQRAEADHETIILLHQLLMENTRLTDEVHTLQLQQLDLIQRVQELVQAKSA